MADELKVRAHFPPALLPLMEGYQGEAKDKKVTRKRYYVSYGGRGSGKSWTYARALLLQAMKEPLRVLCCREVMRTISESVHQLLADQIKSMGLEQFFEIKESSIVGKNGAEFLYAGLRAMDAAKVKSYEGIDVVWVEEAQAVSKRSWGVLIPTIRAEGSEIWVTFNPELDTDDTYVRFVAEPPENTWVQKVTWRDNPWFPQVLEDERKHLLKRDPEAHDHVWEGNPRSVVEGAIYAKEVTAMIADGRVRNVPYDPALPVHTVWDLGWNDQTSILLVQKVVSEVLLIGYLEESFKTYGEWVAELNRLPYVWGSDWLPHDGTHKEQRTGKSAKQWMEGLGRKNVKIIEKLPVETGIRAARMLFPRVYADKTKCSALLNCLKRYRRGVPETTGEPGAPVHDQYSHGADAFRGLAVCVDKIRNERDRPVPHFEARVSADPAMGI